MKELALRQTERPKFIAIQDRGMVRCSKRFRSVSDPECLNFAVPFFDSLWEKVLDIRSSREFVRKIVQESPQNSPYELVCKKNAGSPASNFQNGGKPPDTLRKHL